jgi:hypothetical protein
VSYDLEDEALRALNVLVKASKLPEHGSVNSLDALAQDIEKLPMPDELRERIDPISVVATIDLLRDGLHQGKLPSYRFASDGPKAEGRHYWASPEADGELQSGTHFLREADLVALLDSATPTSGAMSTSEANSVAEETEQILKEWVQSQSPPPTKEDARLICQERFGGRFMAKHFNEAWRKLDPALKRGKGKHGPRRL